METVARFNMDKKNILMSTEEANLEAMRGRNDTLISGPGCSKLTTSLVNVSLKFLMLKSEIRHYLIFFDKKNSVYLVIKW